MGEIEPRLIVLRSRNLLIYAPSFGHGIEMPHSVERFAFGHPHAVLRLSRRNALKLLAHSAFVALVTGCGGGGSNGNDPVPLPDPPTPVSLIDAIPAAGTTVDPSISGFNAIQIADADWRFDYTGECGPTGVAVRHALTDLSGSGDDRDVVDHKLACPLRPGTAYEVRVDATGGDGDRYRSVLEFTSDAERAFPASLFSTGRHCRGVTSTGCFTVTSWTRYCTRSTSRSSVRWWP